MIGLQVRTEGGAVVRRGSCEIDWSEALGEIDQDRFPCFGGLLPYADTMFNGRQVERLRREAASQVVRGLVGEETAAEIDELCRQVQSGSHLYLWFVGD